MHKFVLAMVIGMMSCSMMAGLEIVLDSAIKTGEQTSLISGPAARH